MVIVLQQSEGREAAIPHAGLFDGLEGTRGEQQGSL